VARPGRERERERERGGGGGGRRGGEDSIISLLAATLTSREF